MTQPTPTRSEAGHTPTPRMDAAIARAGNDIGMAYAEARDEGRKLECELAEKDLQWEVAARDAGLYRGTLAVAAQTLGCEEHMVDHGVAALKASHAAQSKRIEELEGALEEALKWAGEVPHPYREFPFIAKARTALAPHRAQREGTK